MPSLFDLMSEEEIKASKKNYEMRKRGDTSYRKNMKIPPDVYIMAELGYYYGWGAIETIKRGYVEAFETIVKDGERVEKRTKIPFTMEEVTLLVEAARKVKYSSVVDAARGTQTAVSSALSKNPQTTFKKGIKDYAEGAKL